MMIIIYQCYRYPFHPDQEVVEPDWQLYLRETANMVVEQQTPKRWAPKWFCLLSICISLSFERLRY